MTEFFLIPAEIELIPPTFETWPKKKKKKKRKYQVDSKGDELGALGLVHLGECCFCLFCNLYDAGFSTLLAFVCFVGL